MTQEAADPRNRPVSRTGRVAAVVLRSIMALASFVTLLGAAVLVILATGEAFGAILEAVFGDRTGGGSVAEVLRVEMILAVDSVLVAIVLFLIGIGLVQLFLVPSLKDALPGWLRIDSLHALEVVLASMTVTVLAVTFLTQVLRTHGSGDVLGLGVAVAAVILSVSLFLYLTRHTEAEAHTHEPPDARG
jgi:uncharacterized membrane protein YqhA